jgi:Lar family restriction alleviation protein
MNETELKPCPFCGNEAKFTDNKNVKSDYAPISYGVKCRNCFVISEYEDNKQLAIKAWNTRTDAELQGKYEKAIEFLWNLDWNVPRKLVTIDEVLENAKELLRELGETK